jgi:origin recognition complex subunit 3
MSANGDDYDDTFAEIQDGFDDTAHQVKINLSGQSIYLRLQACYIFEPSPTTVELPVERPAKRRKANKSGNYGEKQSPIFPPLFDGKENPRSTEGRSDLFHELWSQQEQAVGQVVRHVDASLLADIVHFVKQTSPDEQRTRIPTGLVLTGPNYGLQGRLLEHWRTNHLSQPAEEVIILDNSQAPNLTTALKNIVRSVVVQRKGADWYQAFLNEHKRLIPMNYDLQLLQTFVKREGLNKIVVSILDVEIFDVNALSDLISALSSWIDRLPIVLLFGIATTTELFEARLPKRTVKLLQGRVFDISLQDDSLYSIYQTVQDDPATKLWLGPALSSILLERSKDQDESPESFAGSFRYVYMSHFFANPLSVLLAATRTTLVPATEDLCNAIRNTNSFHTYAESLLEVKGADAVKRLLGDDVFLLKEAMKAVSDGQQAMMQFREAVQFFIRVYHLLQPSTNTILTPFEVDSQVFSGTVFLDGNLYNDTLASLEKLPSDALESLLNQCPLPDSAVDFSTATILSTLHTLHTAGSGIPIRSAQDPKHNTTSTTISRNNTVSLAKHAPKLSKLEKEYTALVQDVHRGMSDYFESRIIDITKLFMNEAFVYDLKMPLASAFTPRSRYAIERALDRPGDYLGCECCTAGSQLAKGTRTDKLPPASLLWQLWCEAGSIVNVRDLWEAFSAAIVDREEEDEDEEEEGGEARKWADENGINNSIDERMALALFYRSLAELRMLGFVKPTKKKVDCLAKAAWKGL